MADAFCDSQAANDASDGLTWANAKLTIEAADVVTGAGGRVFAQDSVSGGFTETQASTKTYTSVGTMDNPTQWIACKTGTTNEPPQTADLVLDRDDSDAGLLQVTGAGNDMTTAGFVDLWGFTLDAADDMNIGGQWTLHHSIATGDRINVNGGIFLEDESELAFQASGFIRPQSSPFTMYGGEITGATAQWGRDATIGATLDGVDLSGLGATVGYNVNALSTKIINRNCKIPASFVPFEGTLGIKFEGLMVGCDSSADHPDTIRQLRWETRQGLVVDDTPFISGGAQDRDSGDGYSFSINPGDNLVLERVSPLCTPWFSFTVAPGDTEALFRVMRKDTGAPADLFNDMFWIEVMSPNEGVGSATSQFAYQTSRPDPGATAAALASSAATWSALGGDTAKEQEIAFVLSPEYAGRARYRAAYAERGTGILPAYLDVKPVVT